MPALLKNLTIDEISLVDEPANDEARVVIVKARRPFDLAPSGANPQETAMPDMDAIQAALAEAEQTIEALTKAKEKAEEERDEAKERAAKAEADLEEAKGEIEKARAATMTPEEAEEAFLKSLPEPARARLIAAEEAVRKAKAAEEEAEAIAKARSFAPGDDEAREIGGLLLRIAKGRTTEEDAARVETLLKSARALTGRADFFKALGTAAGQDAPENPEAALQAKADEIRKAKPALTREQAYAQAVQENPGLYTEYLAKRRATAA